MRFKKSDGRTLFETLIIISFVGILLVVAINRFMEHSRAAKEVILHGELANIRTSIRLYYVINGEYPKSMAELTDKDYLQAYSENTIIQGKYLEHKAVDDEGELLDPFGNKYRYNSQNGEINSLTKGYEGW